MEDDLSMSQIGLKKHYEARQKERSPVGRGVLLREQYVKELLEELDAIDDYTNLYTDEQRKWMKEGLQLSLTIFDLAIERLKQ